MIIYNISSGSKGNCTILIQDSDVIVIDFGISKKRVVSALEKYSFQFEDVKAFLVTHDHSDHASNIFSAPIEKIYASTLTLPKLDAPIDKDHLLLPHKEINIGKFNINPIPLSHDAKNTIGFVINCGDEKLVYITDTGFVAEKEFPLLKNANYYFFESNYDPKMLYESKRPDYLIKRIISDKGHLSNADCGYYICTLMGNNTKEIILAHLSQECNTEEIALKTFESVCQTQLGYIPDFEVKTTSIFHETIGGKDGN